MYRRPPVWLWFNLLSIDAPLVALVWQDFVARSYAADLHLPGRAVLGLTVWAIYLADRILDVRYPAVSAESIRHQFYRRHHVFAKTLLAVVIGFDLSIILLWLRRSVFENGLLLGACVILYLGAFPLTRRGISAWKKPAAAMLFTAGTFLIAWTSAGHPLRQLGWPAAAFCMLCLGNLLMIGRWSRESEPRSYEWAWLLILGACLVGVAGSTWFMAIVLSAGGLLALALTGRRISGDVRCVLADAVLLTPLLFR